ncbi:MAG: cation diffusion facilitator family transporter [candidate division NC10 bacterium]
MHQRHTHGSRHKSRLLGALALTATVLVVELAVALWTGSLSLLADAAHMFTDAGAILLSLGAIWVAERPATATKTYGYYRVEILATLVNGVLLCVLALVILWHAWGRLWAPPEVAGLPIVLAAALGLAANLISMRLLHGGAAESLNVRSAYLEVLGDALSSGAVLVAGAVIALTGWHVADPLAGAVIGLLILPRTGALLWQAVNVLLEGVPPHLDVTEIGLALAEAPGVLRVHDLHVWTLTSGREAMSAHVVVDAGAASDRILQALHLLLHVRFGIDHTTIQVETDSPSLLQITPSARAQ